MIMHTFIIASDQGDMMKLLPVISLFLPASFIHNSKYFISHSSILYQQFYFSLTERQKKINNRASQNKVKTTSGNYENYSFLQAHGITSTD